MAYDPIRGETVLFGGFPNRDDTWTWDGVSWSLRSTAGPAARSNAQMVFSERDGVIVLFGGTTAACCPIGASDETWEWNGAEWTLRDTPLPRPDPRYGHAMLYDSSNSVVVVAGGGRELNGNFRILTDLWEWNGGGWTRVQETSPARYSTQGAYDSIRATIVLNGGQFGAERETWEATRRLIGDVDGDGIVTLSDLSGLLAEFGHFGANLTSDFTGDAAVDLNDLAILLASFGTECP